MDLFENKYQKPQSGLSILSLNVQSPPLERAKKLAGAVSRIGANVVVLSELSSGEGSEFLVESLYQLGFNASWKKPVKNEYSSAILVKDLKYRHLGFSLDYGENRIRFSRIKINNSAICIVGLYVPSLNEQNIDKREIFFEGFSGLLREFRAKYSDPIIVAGDINSIPENHLPMYDEHMREGFTFYNMMSSFGLIDMISQMHTTQQYTWFFPNKDGQLIDNFFASLSLSEDIYACEILDHFRTDKLSDHSGILLKAF